MSDVDDDEAGWWLDPDNQGCHHVQDESGNRLYLWVAAAILNFLD